MDDDFTYVSTWGGFVYVAVIMDAFARWIIGYAMSRRIDARLTLAALDAAIALRQPPPGCMHDGDRGSQYAAEKYRDRLREAKLVGSMGRRGNSYDNAMMESLMKTLKVAGLSPLEFETVGDVAEQLPAFIEKCKRQAPSLIACCLSPEQYEKQHPGRRSRTPPDRVRPEGPTPWREANWPGVTIVTREPLEHWHDREARQHPFLLLPTQGD